MARILIIRFSALGDVAMTIPVIHSLAVQYPQHEITVLSRAVWQPLFQGLPTNVGFVGADLTLPSATRTHGVPAVLYLALSLPHYHVGSRNS